MEHRILHSLLNVPTAVELVMTKFTDQVNWRFISQINERHLKSSPKITKIFQWYDHFNILCITISRRSSCNFCLESEWLRICYNIVTWKVSDYRVFFGPHSVQMQRKSPYCLNTGEYRPEKTPHLDTSCNLWFGISLLYCHEFPVFCIIIVVFY